MMSSQSIIELDPLFEKALKLLRSKSKESGAQLKQLLDNYLAKYKTDDHEHEKPKSSKSSSSKSEDEKQKRDPEKRSYDKLKQDFPEQSQEAKRPRLDSPTIKDEKPHKEKEEKSHRDKDGKDKDKDREKDKDRHRKDKEHRDKDRDREKKEKDREKEKQREREKEKQRQHEKEKKEKQEKEKGKEREREKERERQKEKKREKEKSDKSSEETTDDEKTDMDADDFAFGLGIACVVCRGIDVTPGNKLVECQECHSLYHQECHKPGVTEQDVTDPRFVWYCSKCTKTMKKLVAKPAQKQKSSTSVSQPPPKDTSNNSTKPVKTESSANVLPFRRIEAKVNAKETSVSSSAKPLSGLASLAANLSGKSSGEQSEKGKSLLKSQPAPSSVGGTSMLASADKRLQMMKKKAAQKQMEKKSSLK